MVKLKNKKTLKKAKTIQKKVVKVKKTKSPKDTKNVTDEFLTSALEHEEEENEGEAVSRPVHDDSNNSDDEGEIGSDIDEEVLAEKHKKDLEKLKDTDPEFYQFLQANDKKLLDFNLSDEEEDQEDEDEDSGVPEAGTKLEVASDESDFEDEDVDKDDRVITLKMIKKWQNDIQTDKSNKTVITLTQAFHAALKRVTNAEEEDSDEPIVYKVEGSAIFNGIIQLCVLELGPAVRKYLGLKHGSKVPPHKCKKFNKVKRVLKSYFTDLLKLLLAVTSSNIQTVLLKHLHYMSPLLTSYPNLTKSIAKRLIKLWGSADDSVRVIAFFCILRITNHQQESILETVLKSMYMTYVKNAKFVSLNSLAGINFMRRSLVEMFSLDANVSYAHVFLYIRQLAIHLRNAITVKKKENIQAVCNWQYVNSLRLWGSLLSVTYSKPVMQQLVYPFVQVCLGTMKLVPTAQYFPMRFHIIQILIDLSRETGVFVPVLPFLLEVLTSFDFDKKHQKVSMKPMHFTCLLRLSKSQMQENGFKDMVIETIYGQVLEYLSNNSHTVGFPDLSLLCIIQIKQFLKSCKTPNYHRKMKQVLEKIEQNCKIIETERAKLTCNLTDFKQIEGWEAQIKAKITPLTVYYESWNNLRTTKRNKQLTNNEEIGDYQLPKMKKRNVSDGTSKKVAAGPAVLFPSSDEDDSDAEGVLKKRFRGKRGGKNAKKGNRGGSYETGPVEDSGDKDIVQDLRMDEW